MITKRGLQLLIEVSLSIERFFLIGPATSSSIDLLGIGLIGSVGVVVFSCNVLNEGSFVDLISTSPPLFISSNCLSFEKGSIKGFLVSSVVRGSILEGTLTGIEVGSVGVALLLIDIICVTPVVIVLVLVEEHIRV